MDDLKRKKDQGNNNGSNRRKGGVSDRVLDEWASATDKLDSNDRSNDNALTNRDPNNQLARSSSKQSWEEDAQLSDYHDLLQLTEEMLSGRNANRTSTVITALVQYIIR
jgi:hypothetical protein